MVAWWSGSGPGPPPADRPGQCAAAALGRPVARGEFGASMQVELVNDGPVTLIIDTRERA